MRTKKAILNFLTDALPQIVIAVLGIYKIKVFLSCLGENTLGLYQLYGQLIVYVTIFEAGMTSSVLFRFFKSIGKKNKKETETIMATSKTVFNYIGLIIFTLGLVLSFFVTFFIKDNTFNPLYVQFTFMLFLTSQVVNYFALSYKTFFEAQQKKYVTNLIIQPAIVAKSILEIVLVLSGFELITILILYIITNVLTNILIIFIYNRSFKDINKKAEKDFSMLKDIKHLMVHRVSGLVASNIDIVVISKFLGLSQVVVYTSYNYIVEALRQFIDKIYNSLTGGIGNIVATDKEKSYNIFMEYNSFVFFVATVICVPLYYAITPFINMWYRGEIYTSETLSILFVAVLFYNIIKAPIHMFIYCAGLFKETKIFYILEVIVHLILSLILIKHFGIAGALISAMVSLIICEYLAKPHVIHKKVFNKTTFKYYTKNFVYLTSFVLLIIMFKIMINNFGIVITDMLSWFIFSSLIFAVNFMITVMIYYTQDDIEFIKRILELWRTRNAKV